MPKIIMPARKDVHTEHCCVIHGCKYGDDGCTVYSGEKEQSYPCEHCDYDQEYLNHMDARHALHKAMRLIEHVNKTTELDMSNIEKSIKNVIDISY